MSKFSDFIRNATPEEKEKVYMDVMEKATERQMKVAREIMRRNRNALRKLSD